LINAAKIDQRCHDRSTLPVRMVRVRAEASTHDRRRGDEAETGRCTLAGITGTASCPVTDR